MTVVNACEQLLIEGYLEGKTGAGTYVAATLPEEMLQIARDGSPRRKTSPASQSHILSRRGKVAGSENFDGLARARERK
jgi:GntR family transcriptional regulator/MocR family aminotransferase